MSTTIATLKALLTMDVSGFTEGARRAEGDSERMGSNMLGGAKKFAMFGAAAAAAAVPVAMFLKGAIDNASDLEETISKNKTIFGAAADELMTWASDAPKALGMTKNAALDATGTLGNLFTQLGVGTEQARKMSQANVQLATDFASFHNADPAAVIEAMTAAYRGEFDAVQKYVPLLNAANVEEKALIMTKKASKDALTAQDKALAVNAMMMEGAGSAAGDFARTSDSAANKARIAAASFEEMKTKLGNVLLPAWSAVLSFITGQFFPALEKLASILAGIVGPAFEKVQSTVQLFLSAIRGDLPAGTVLDSFGNHIVTLGEQIKKILFGIRDVWFLFTQGVTEDELDTNLGDWGIKIKEVADTVRNFASQIPGWLDQAKEAFNRLTEAMAPFWAQIKGNENLLVTVGIAIGVVLVAAFIALASAAWSAAAGVIAATWPFIAIAAVIFGVVTALRYAYENWEWFRNGIAAVVSWLVTNVPPAFELIKAGIAVVVDWITGTAVPFLQQAFGSFIGFLQNTLLPAVSTVWNAIVVVISTVSDILMGISQRIVSFIADNWNWIAGLASAIWDQIRSVITNAWQIISNIIQLFLNIITGNWGAAWDNIKNIVSAVTDILIGTVNNTARALGNAFMLIVSFAGNMVGGIFEKLNDIENFFRGLAGRILGAVGNLGNLLRNAGMDIIRGLLGGIDSMIGALKDKLSFVTKLIPIGKGPPVVDRALLVPAGRDIMGGLIGAIAAAIPALRAQLRAVTSEVGIGGNLGTVGFSGLGDAVAAGIRGGGSSGLRPPGGGSGGAAGMTVVVNGRARSEDGVAVVNALTAWERVAGTTWRNGARELAVSNW